MIYPNYLRYFLFSSFHKEGLGREGLYPVGYTEGVSKGIFPIQKKIDFDIKTDKTGPYDYLACLSYKKPPSLPPKGISLANARLHSCFSFTLFSTVGAGVYEKRSTFPFPITVPTLYSDFLRSVYSMCFVLLTHIVYKYYIYSLTTILYTISYILSYIFFIRVFTIRV
jgi:hypothetical protein